MYDIFDESKISTFIDKELRLCNEVNITQDDVTCEANKTYINEDPKPFSPIQIMKDVASGLFSKSTIAKQTNGGEIKCWCDIVEQNQNENEFCCAIMEDSAPMQYVDVGSLLLLLIMYFILR